MNTRMHAAALVAALGFVAACGGSSGTSDAPDDSVAETAAAVSTPETDPPQTDPPPTDPPATEPPATEPPATDPPATDPPVTDPPVTEPPVADLPEWASGEIVTVESDTGPLELPVELAPFCETSRSFYIAANGLDFVADGQVNTTQQLFAAMGALAPLAIETAPSADFTAEPTAVLEQLAVIIPAFEEIGYDTNRVSEVSDPNSLFTALQGFTETRDGLRSFLVEACGADGSVLDDQALEAVVIAADAAGETIEPTEPVEPVPGSAITNSDSSIEVSVPDEWADVAETSDQTQSTLSASTDLAAFNALEAPGITVLRGLGGFRDGGFVGRVLETESDLEDAGCTLVDESNYDDGVYVGQERVYACGNDALDVRIFGGTEADEALYAMVLLVQPADEPGVRQLIVDTFFVI